MRSAQFSLRQMLAATVACAIVLGIATPLLRWLPSDRSIRLGVGFVAGVAVFALEVLPFAFRRQRFEAAAGKSLLQVGRLPPWACMIGACAVLLIVVIVAVPTLLISTALGAVYFAIMAAFAGSLFAQFLRGTRWPVLEICENGIILAQRGFVAWRQVRDYSWGAVRTPPRLVLSFQTGRDFIRIPSDKRDEVESLVAAHVERFERRVRSNGTRNKPPLQANPDEPGSEKSVLVIGREIANAAEADRRWKEQGTRDSPLPKQGYDFWHGDLSLMEPAPNPLDDPLQKIAGRYAASDPQKRAAIRDSIGMDGFYTLIAFGKRSAVFAMREKNAEIARHGLIAIAMIEQQRVDYRDILICLSLLYHATNRVGADADKMFQETALLAEPDVAKQIVGFVAQTSHYRSLRSSWGYDEVETPNGVGLIGWQFAKNEPTVDIKSLAMDVAQIIAADKYQPDGISVAAKLPPVWLSRGRNAELGTVIARIRGGATLHGILRPNEHPKHREQGFFMFIVETSQPDDAQTLLRLSKAKDVQGHCMVGVAAGRLFALIVARPIMVGVEAFETPKTLARFEDNLSKILVEYADKAR